VTESPGLFVIGHGTRDAAGVDEFRRFLTVVRAAAPDVPVGGGFIEFAAPISTRRSTSSSPRGAAATASSPSLSSCWAPAT
jgi:sirohydrochlorin ferrochelatase